MTIVLDGKKLSEKSEEDLKRRVSVIKKVLDPHQFWQQF